MSRLFSYLSSLMHLSRPAGLVGVSVASGPRWASLPTSRFEPAPDYAAASSLNKSQAEDLLDWLEANGYEQDELSYSPRAGFTVR